MDQERILSLLESYLENCLTAEDRAELQRLLLASPQARRLFWEYLHQHALLGELQAETRGRRLALDERTAASRLATLPSRRRLVRARWLALGAAAVLLTLSLLFLGGRRGVEGTPAVAELEEVEGEVYLVTATGKVAAQPKKRLYPGQALQTHGEGSYAVVKYSDSTRLEVGPDTTLDLLAGPNEPDAVKKVFLKEGTLTAEVAPQPRDNPMILVTPHAEVVSSGNKLSFSSAGEATRIELEEGQARCRRTSDGKSIEVPPGWYAVASTAEEPFEAQPLPALTTRPRLVLPKTPAPILALAFTADGQTLVGSGWLGDVKFWDAKTGQLRRTVHTHTRDAKALALSRDGKLLATTEDRVVKLWDTGSGAELLVLKGFRFTVRALAFAPDGRTLATAGGGAKKEGAELKLWNIGTGAPKMVRLTSAGPRREVLALAFSPDGRMLASGGHEGTVKLWDAVTGKERRSLKAHTQKVRCLAFSSDGRLLATAGHDRSVRLWDTATGEERVLIRTRRNVSALAFAPDGKTLATADWSRLVKLWALSAVRDVP
jgi:hypothetical protein